MDIWLSGTNRVPVSQSNFTHSSSQSFAKCYSDISMIYMNTIIEGVKNLNFIRESERFTPEIFNDWLA